MAAGRILREARLAADLSQRALARRSGVPASVISAIETSQREPSVTLLERLLEALGKRLVAVESVDPGELARRGDDLRQALRLASLLPHEGRVGAALRFPRLPSRSA